MSSVNNLSQRDLEFGESRALIHRDQASKCSKKVAQIAKYSVFTILFSIGAMFASRGTLNLGRNLTDSEFQPVSTRFALIEMGIGVAVIFTAFLASAFISRCSRSESGANSHITYGT